MHYVLFRHAADPSQQGTSNDYYAIASKMEGFIDSTMYHSPQDPSVQFLLARFANKQAVLAWRDNQLRLGMMHSAKHNVLKDFRLTVGMDEVVPEGQRVGEERVVVIYKRPAADMLREEHMVLGYVVDEEKVKEIVMESEFYTEEKTWIWIATLQSGMDPYQFERYLKRIPGDAVYHVHVEREYGKTNRREAPVGLDKAESQAVAEMMKAAYASK